MLKYNFNFEKKSIILILSDKKTNKKLIKKYITNNTLNLNILVKNKLSDLLWKDCKTSYDIYEDFKYNVKIIIKTSFINEAINFNIKNIILPGIVDMELIFEHDNEPEINKIKNKIEFIFPLENYRKLYIYIDKNIKNINKYFEITNIFNNSKKPLKFFSLEIINDSKNIFFIDISNIMIEITLLIIGLNLKGTLLNCKTPTYLMITLIKVKKIKDNILKNLNIQKVNLTINPDNINLIEYNLEMLNHLLNCSNNYKTIINTKFVNIKLTSFFKVFKLKNSILNSIFKYDKDILCISNIDNLKINHLNKETVKFLYKVQNAGTLNFSIIINKKINKYIIENIKTLNIQNINNANEIIIRNIKENCKIVPYIFSFKNYKIDNVNTLEYFTDIKHIKLDNIKIENINKLNLNIFINNNKTFKDLITKIFKYIENIKEKVQISKKVNIKIINNNKKYSTKIVNFIQNYLNNNIKINNKQELKILLLNLFLEEIYNKKLNINEIPNNIISKKQINSVIKNTTYKTLNI